MTIDELNLLLPAVREEIKEKYPDAELLHIKPYNDIDVGRISFSRPASDFFRLKDTLGYGYDCMFKVINGNSIPITMIIDMGIVKVVFTTKFVEGQITADRFNCIKQYLKFKSS